MEKIWNNPCSDGTARYSPTRKLPRALQRCNPQQQQQQQQLWCRSIRVPARAGERERASLPARWRLLQIKRRAGWPKFGRDPVTTSCTPARSGYLPIFRMLLIGGPFFFADIVLRVRAYHAFIPTRRLGFQEPNDVDCPSIKIPGRN